MRQEQNRVEQGQNQANFGGQSKAAPMSLSSKGGKDKFFSAFLIIVTFTGDFVAIFRELFVEMIYLIFLCVSYGIFCAYLVRTRTILHVLSRI